MARRPSSIALDICGPGATGALKAAVHRFRGLPLEIRVPADMRCAAPAVRLPVAQRAGTKPYEIDDGAVERYWSRIAP